MLEGLVEQKEFIYRRDQEGRLLSERNSKRLADRDLGSAIRTFRMDQMKASKFPLYFWK